MSLSDKKIHLMTEKSNLIVKEGVNDFRFNIRDVKEFIKKIKEKLSFIINNSDYTEDDLRECIDKEAGKELI